MLIIFQNRNRPEASENTQLNFILPLNQIRGEKRLMDKKERDRKDELRN